MSFLPAFAYAIAVNNTANGQAELNDADPEDTSDDEHWHHLDQSPFVRELRRLEDLKQYQKRGYEFEHFIANLFRHRYFRVTSNPRTAKPRQTDLLATRGDESYIIEVKWRASKTDIADVDSLFTRLEAAPASAAGLMVSFKGFTKTAIERVEQRSDRPVLLMTGEELVHLVEWDEHISHLLIRKKAELLSSRKAYFAAATVKKPSIDQAF
jgi:Holliday junction resolvase